MKAFPLIKIIVAAVAVHGSLALAQSPGPDTFDPTKDPSGTAAGGPAAKPVLILPGDKSSEKVKDDERNPFGKSESEMAGKGDKGSNEENKIQEQLAHLHASGVAPGENGLRLLLGDMILKEGDIMPPVLKEQTLALRVGQITRQAVQLIWVEKKYVPGMPQRVVTLPIDLRPSIRYVGHGEGPKAKEEKVSEVLKRANAVEIPDATREKLGLISENYKKEAKAKASKDSPPAAPMPSPAPAAPPAPAPVVASAPEAAPESKGEEKNQPVAPVENNASGEDAPLKSNSALKFHPVVKLEPPKGDVTANPETGAPAPASQEPASWRRAMGLMDELKKPDKEKK